MSRSFQGLAFRAGRNDTPFLYAQRMQEQGIQNQRLQEKRRQEQQDASQKWVQELRNTNFEAIDILPDNIIDKRVRGLMDESTRAMRSSQDGIISQDERMRLEEMKFNIKQDHTFLKSANEEVKNVIDYVGKNDKYFNPSVNGVIEGMYKTEIVTPEGQVNRQFDPKKLYSAVNSYENLNVPNIVKDAVSNLTKTINEEVTLGGGLKKETRMKYNSFTKIVKDKNGNDTFAIDDNGMIEVDASPELVSFLSQNELMRTAIDGKREELVSERGGNVTRKEALDALLKENNPTEKTMTITGDPTNKPSPPKDQLNLSIVTDDKTVFADADQALKTGVAGYTSVYVDLDQDITKAISVNTEDLDGEPLTGKFTFSKMGSDEQGREYIELAQSTGMGNVDFKKIPFNERNLKLIKNNLSKQSHLEPFNKVVNDLQSQFRNKKAITVTEEDFNTASSYVQDALVNLPMEELLGKLESYGIDVSKVKSGGKWNNKFKESGNEVYFIEDGEIGKTKWSDNPEHMKEIAKMMYNKNKTRFIGEFGGSAPTQSSSQETGESGVNWN